ncbi:MAG: efflux RND transporter periplasmic adaptor subunit [Elusimicrobiales bacterium]
MKNKCFLSMILIYVVFYSCYKKDTSNKIEEFFYVGVKRIQRMDLKQEIVVVGNIKAKDEAVLYPRVGGKLIENLVKEGDFVKKEDPVALIKRDEVGAVYEPSPVPSTIDGYIGRVYQDVGADVNPMTPIALVVNQSIVRVQMEIPEKYLSDISQGQRIYFTVSSYPSKNFYGKIDKISPVIDKVSRTFLAESIMENSSGMLKSGMTAEVHIVLKEAKNAVAVPKSAVIWKNNKPYIYLADRQKNIAVEKEIKIGIINTDYVEAKNVNDGEYVITVGLYGIKDGVKIKINE